jgi:glycosyltransferase involved in cell wall biosynthesis
LTARHGWRVSLLAIGEPSADQYRQAELAGAELYVERLKLEWMQAASDDMAATIERLRMLVERLHPDVVHANQFAAACLDRAVCVPIVLTLHSDVLSWRRWTLGLADVPAEWRQYMALVRQALQRADTVVAVSRFLAEEVRTCYGVARPIEVIHNGWPVPARQARRATEHPSPAAARRPFSTPPRGEAITLVAGRVWDAAKNVPLAAEAAQGWDPGRVVLAGEVAHPDGGQATVPDPLEPLGRLGRAELDGWLDRARVYLSPARYDPFGLLPLQAALHGCALLLSDIPSYRVPMPATRRRAWRMPTPRSPDGCRHDPLRPLLPVGYLRLEPRQRALSARADACAAGARPQVHLLRTARQLVARAPAGDQPERDQ